VTARLEVLGEDGEWHEVPGVVSVELHQEQPEQQPTPLQLFIEEYRPVHNAYVRAARAYAAAARPVVEELARGIQAYGRALRAARVIDQDGRPVRRPERPAWQSPYGPPGRR
jgi:hypothetical protein